MKHPRIIIAGAGLAALAAAGGITAASASGTASSQSPRARRPCAPHLRPSRARQRPSWSAAKGLPLYIYRPDTATTSLVTGGLAGLWPPLTSPAVAGARVTGKVAVLATSTASRSPTTVTRSIRSSTTALAG